MTSTTNVNNSPRQQSSPSKRYSHAQTPPYNRYHRTSLSFDSPDFHSSPNLNRRDHSSIPSSENGSPYFRRQQATGGAETLADELAQAMNDDSGVGDDDYASGFDSSRIEQTDRSPVFRSPAWTESPTKARGDGLRARDSGVELMSSVENTPSKDLGNKYAIHDVHHTSKYPISASKDGHKIRRRAPRRHSGSVGGLEDQIVALSQRKKSEDLFMQSGLDASIADVAGLASFDISTEGNPIPIFLESLTSLPSESGLEIYSRDYARTAAKVASSTTTSLQSFSMQISSIFNASYTFSPDDIDTLLDDLSTLTPPTSQPDISAAVSHTTRSTDTLLDVLSSLSDTLHMSRETATTASRRLQTTRELTTQARRELDQAEAAQRWIEDNEQERRIAARESAKMCRELLAGFEAVCGGMRERLVAGG